MRVYELRDEFRIDALTPTERPDPVPGHGQVLVKLRAVSLNFRDLLILKGLYNPKLKFPRIPVSDGVGEIVAVGPGVSTRKVGERVTPLFMPGWLDGEVTTTKAVSALGGDVDGLLAEYAVLPESGVLPAPEHLSDEEAATLPCAGVTAWHGLVEIGQVKAGETVLVLGTGGVSIFALQFARMHGARVIATSSSDEKLARVREMGASETINYRTTPDWEKRVLDLTGRRGVDHVIEVGGAGTLNRSLRSVKMGGHVCLIGVLAGPADFNPTGIIMNAVRLQGLFVGNGAMFARMNRAISLHGMKPVVDRVFPFDNAIEALRHLESGSHFGKVVIRID